MPHEKAVAIILEGKGKHFDPDIVDAFVAVQDSLKAIAQKFVDSDIDLAKKKESLERISGVT